MNRSIQYRVMAFAPLLLFVFLLLPACGGTPTQAEGQGGSAEKAAEAGAAEGSEAAPPDRTRAASTEETAQGSAVAERPSASTTANGPAAETPGDVAQVPKGVPKFRDFFEEGEGNEPVQIQGASGSAGAIPAVKPFNFGRDPGGPEDKTLYITVPKLGLQSVPAFDEVSEDALKKGTAHIPATGYPWQEGANVYVAGHRIGYPGTGSDRVFYDLDQLFPGDEIFVTDSAGGEYKYVVTKQVVVPPDNVGIMNPVPGKSLLSLQTCTLPDYAKRIVVQAELI